MGGYYYYYYYYTIFQSGFSCYEKLLKAVFMQLKAAQFTKKRQYNKLESSNLLKLLGKISAILKLRIKIKPIKKKGFAIGNTEKSYRLLFKNYVVVSRSDHSVTQLCVSVSRSLYLKLKIRAASIATDLRSEPRRSDRSAQKYYLYN